MRAHEGRSQTFSFSLSFSGELTSLGTKEAFGVLSPLKSSLKKLCFEKERSHGAPQNNDILGDAALYPCSRAYDTLAMAARCRRRGVIQ